MTFESITQDDVAVESVAVLSEPKPADVELQDVGGDKADTPVQRTPVRERFRRGIDWGVFFWMAAMHIGAIVACWHFSWAGLITCLVLNWVGGCLGITLGFHRLLTHGSFVTPRWVKYFLSLCGMMAVEGSPLRWVATHRKHHAHSDEDEDPHSPLDGFWWSHMLWFHPKMSKEASEALFQRWAPDMYRDPVQRFFDKTLILVPVLTGVILFTIGHFTMGSGWSLLLWGLCFRSVLSYHSTWFVNSATHMWGYKNYETKDQSRNLWWVALLSFGEGWHNNHHAHQRLARHGHKWWEFDLTYQIIRFMSFVGLAKKIQDRLPTSRQPAAD